MKASKNVSAKIEESYRNFKPYLDDGTTGQELKEMCEYCELYCGIKHDYENCRNRNCFQFWLCYKYLEWCNSYGC